MTRKEQTELFYLKNARIKHKALQAHLNTLNEIIFWNNLGKLYLDAGLIREAEYYVDMAHDALYAMH